MVDLSTLTFKVNTQALVDAKNAIDDLVVAQKALSGSGTNAGKGADAAEKGVENLGKGAERTATQLKGMERVLERQATKMAILTGATVQLADGQSSLDRVFSAGQAGMLASAKVAGATKGQFEQLAGSIRELISITGTNKFDDSASGLFKLSKEVDELGRSYNTTTGAIKLTAQETRDLARDTAALKVLLDKNKISSQQYELAVNGLTQSYANFSQEKAQMIQQSKMTEERMKREAQVQIDRNNAVQKSSETLFKNRIAYINEEIKAVNANSNAWREYFMQQGTLEKPGRANTKPIEQPMDSSMKLFYKEQALQAKELAKAEKFLATEMQRVDAVLNELNHEHSQGSILSEKHANSISRFANQLKAAGVSGTTATAQLEQYRGKMQQIEAIENRRAQNRLANALAPQISDVAVSIAGGMPLHLVIMQQGLQIRDLIGQSGVAADQLQKTMRDAMKNMVTSIAGTVAALGTMTFGALADAGKGVVDFATKVSGTQGTIAALNTSLAASAQAGGAFSAAILMVGRALSTLAVTIAATGVGAFVIGIAAATYEFIKLIGANNALVRELAVTGNVFGVTTASSLQYVEGLTKVGATTREAISILGQMSKAGNLSREQIDLVGKAAVDMNRTAGVAIEDTVKRFSDLAKDPIKALSTLQIQTGAVQPEIIKLVTELTNQGGAARASGIAVEELARIMGVQTAKMIEDLHPLTVAWTEFKNLISDIWTGLGNMINRAMGNIPATQKLMEGMADRQQLIDSLSAGTAADGAFKKRIANLKAQQETDRESLRLLNQRNSAEIQLAQTRSISERERVKAEEAAKKNRTGGGGRGGRAAPTEKEVNFYKEIDKVYDSMVNKAKELTPLEIKLNELRSDPKFLALKQEEQLQIEKHLATRSQEANAIIAAKEAQEQHNKIILESRKAYEDSLKVYTDSAKSAEDRLLSMQEEAKAVALAEELQISLAQAIEMTAIARLREQQTAVMADESRVLAIEREIQARQKIIAEMGRKDSQEVAKGYADDLKKEFESMRDGIADSITTALFEGGKAGSQKIRQVIENALREPINVMVTAIVNTLLGSIMGGGQGGNILSSLFGGGGGGSQGISAIKQLFTAGKSFLDGSKIMSEAVDSWTRAADWAATSSNSTVAGAGNWMQANPGVGSALGMAGNAFAGYGIQKLISGGYEIGNGNIVDAITVAASAYFGPIAGVVAGIVNRAFGRKLKDTGVEGTFSGEDQFAGNSYEFYKGGWFRSDKTKRSALDAETTDALGDAFKAVRDGILDMSGALGLGAGALDGYTKSIKFSTKGMNEQQVQEAWAKEFTAMSEEMAQRFMGTFETTTRNFSFGSGGTGILASALQSIVGGGSRTTTTWTPGEFVREGETALEALTRLSTAIKTVNPMLDVLGLSMYEVSLAGGDMASKLVDLFGNAETMLGLTTSYYQNYYSEAERTAEATKQMTTALAELGINTLPMSRDAYRDLVESQDLTTEAGRKMFAELMKLAPAFSELTSAMSEVTNGVIDEVRRLRGEIYGSSAAALEAQFAIATAAARAGDSNAMAQLPALSQALEETARLNAVTAADLAISRARLAASLTETLATQGTAIPAFASGGLYGGGLALVGERGPELINFNRAGRVHNNSETTQLLSSSNNTGMTQEIARAMIQEMRKMNSEMSMMRAETKATALNTSKSTRLLERVTRDGESLQVTNV